MSADGFLSRWARRKEQVQNGVPVAAEPTDEAAPPLPVAPTAEREGVRADLAPSAPSPVPAAPPAPTLADVSALAPGDEVSRFVARGVDEGVRRAAVKKLFTDPHFNVMDGLDIYIDDYGIPDPIPMAMLRQLNQAKAMGLFAAEEAAEAQAAAEQAAAAVAPAAPAAAAPAEPVAVAIPDPGLAEPMPTTLVSPAEPAPAEPPRAAHEDPDLQLQPDDAAGRPGAATRAGAGER